MLSDTGAMAASVSQGVTAGASLGGGVGAGEDEDVGVDALEQQHLSVELRIHSSLSGTFSFLRPELRWTDV